MDVSPIPLLSRPARGLSYRGSKHVLRARPDGEHVQDFFRTFFLQIQRVYATHLKAHVMLSV